MDTIVHESSARSCGRAMRWGNNALVYGVVLHAASYVVHVASFLTLSSTTSTTLRSRALLARKRGTALLWRRPGRCMKLCLPNPNWVLYISPTASMYSICLLYTSDAADERSSVDL